MITQVCPNGYISFGSPETDFTPSLFPRSSVDEPGVAPFWEDFNVNNGGNISYEIHTNITSLPLLSQVNQFIRSQQQNKFAGIWMLVAEWDSVPRFGTTTPVSYTIMELPHISVPMHSYLLPAKGTI